MAKYIVEAPEVKKGQKVSSGGIREKGKLTSQFKNPVPYEEQVLTPTSITPTQSIELVNKEQVRIRNNETVMYLLGLVWQEFGEPVVRSGLHRLGDFIVSKINAHPTQFLPSSNYEILEVEAEDIDTTQDLD